MLTTPKPLKISAHRNALVTLGIFASSLVIMGLSTDRTISLYDEGVILTGAVRAGAGHILHRDFYTPYGPGQFYSLALLFKLFGPSVLVERIWDAVVKAAIVACAQIIAARLTTVNWSLMVAAACAIWLASGGTPGYPAWPALLASMIGMICLLDVFRGSAHFPRLVSAGMCVGVATLYRYDIGGTLCLFESLVLLAYGLSQNPSRETRARAVMSLLLPFACGVAAVCVPIALAYLILGVVPDLVFDILTFPSHNYSAMRGLPLPSEIFSGLSVSPMEYIVYLPLAACIAATVVLLQHSFFAGNVQGGQASRAPREIKWILGLLTAVTLSLYINAYVRTSAVHATPALVPSFIILALICSAYSRRRSPFVAMALGFAVIAGGIPTIRALQHVVADVNTNIKSSRSEGLCRPVAGLERIRCLELPDDSLKAVEFLRTVVPEGDTVFVGLSRNDKTYANDVGVYFVADFRPPTKWYHFDPGLQNTVPIQSAVIADLERNKPGYALMDSQWDGVSEPNRSSVSSGVMLLDEYLRKHYRQIAAFGTYSVQKRVDPPPAAANAATGQQP
jgi:hypothetical protein